MRILLLFYVDDMSIAYPGTAVTIAKEIKRRLAEKYKVTNLGTAKQFLGIEISTETSGKQAAEEISLGQKAYITSVLKRFGMENAHGAATPMATDVKLDEAEKHGASARNTTRYIYIVRSVRTQSLQLLPPNDAPDSSQASSTVPEDSRRPSLALSCQG